MSEQSFTNWAVTAPYFNSYECGFIKVDGTWDSDANCHKSVKLCTVCKVSGKTNHSKSLKLIKQNARKTSASVERNLYGESNKLAVLH